MSDRPDPTPGMVRELIRSGSTRHSYPVLIVSVGLFALASLGIAAAAEGVVRVVAIGMAAAGAIVALGLAAFVGRRPDLLWSEDHIERMRVLELVADSESPSEGNARLLLDYMRDPAKHPKAPDGGA